MDLTQMATRQKVVRYIISGFYPYVDEAGRKLRIVALDDDDLYEADEIFAEAYDDAISFGLMTDDEYLQFLYSYAGWTEKEEETLVDILPKHIEEFCVQIYECLFKSETKDKTRKYLARAKEEVESLSRTRYSLSYITATGVASYSRTLYLLERGLFKYDPEYWPNLHHCFNFYFSNQLGDSDLRYLSRKSPWADIWASSKKTNGSIFSRSPSSFTSEQQRLLLWSSMYDNIRESPDSPDDSIFDDDDAMDGWLILQRRKSEKAKLEAEGEKYVKNKNAGEVFIVAERPEDVKRIMNLNSQQTKAVMKSRFKKMKELGTAKDTDFADVRQRIQTEATQRFINSQRRR